MRRQIELPANLALRLSATQRQRIEKIAYDRHKSLADVTRALIDLGLEREDMLK